MKRLTTSGMALAIALAASSSSGLLFQDPAPRTRCQTTFSPECTSYEDQIRRHARTTRKLNRD